MELTTKERVLAESDFLHLYVPMKADTLHLIGEAELAAMKSTAYLINTSARAQVIDEEALFQALTSGRLAGAALDNLEMKPDVTNPLPFSLATLAVIWVINFFVVLPIIRPEFVHVVPYGVSLTSSLLFGAAVAAVLYDKLAFSPGRH